MNSKLADFTAVMRALQEFTPSVLEQALRLSQTDSLYRSEKILGQAQWLHDLQATFPTVPYNLHRNLIWRAVALAPAGFCHPRSSMIGTLLEDLAAGMPFDQVAERFARKMHPHNPINR